MGRQASLSETERAALALRIASHQLALDQPLRTLKTVSDYFRRAGQEADRVDAAFGLLLAFGYGRKGDVEQSLAWFSRVHRLSNARGYGAEVSQRGVGLLLQTLTTDRFETIARDWKNDEFINLLIGRERARRGNRVFRETEIDLRAPFWMLPGTTASVDIAPFSETREPVIGLLVSLSDKAAGLGKSMKEGVELALGSETGVSKPLRLEMRDIGASPDAASAAVREFAAGKAQVVLGPLLSEPAVAAAQTAREVGIPLLALSKSERFSTGGPVYRLGATAASQIESLVPVAYGQKNISKFGIVSSNSPTSQDLVRVFKERLESLRLPIIFETTLVGTDDASLMRAAQEIEQHESAEGVFIPEDLTVATKLLSYLSPATRRRCRPLGGATWDNPTRIANSQTLFEGALFVSPFFVESPRPEVRSFVDAYRAKFGAAPNFIAAQAFDAAKILAAAVRKAQSDAISLPEAMSRMPPLNGATGTVTISGGGELKRVFKVVEVSRDGFTELSNAGEVAPHQIIMRGNERVDSTTGMVR
jgi:branched-chain amino acid transport system substrate-binding protein